MTSADTFSAGMRSGKHPYVMLWDENVLPKLICSVSLEDTLIPTLLRLQMHFISVFLSSVVFKVIMVILHKWVEISACIMYCTLCKFNVVDFVVQRSCC